MEWLKDLGSNYMLIAGITAWITAQILKCLTGIFKVKKFSVVEMMFGTGGMPSSHSAAVCALATGAALKYGFSSGYFAIAAILAVIVMRDAMGMRNEVGKHAKTLNAIINELFKSEKHPEDYEKTHKELVGHTPLQVYAGVATGIAVAFLMSIIPAFGIWA